MEIITGVGECQLNVGEEMKLSHSVSPSEASDYELSWESSNPSVVEVDKNGIIKAKSIGLSDITVCFKNFPDLKPKNIIVYSVESESYANSELLITYDQTCLSSSNNENWYIFFNIENPNHKFIKECKIEVYDINGVMSDTQTINSSVQSNFAGKFKLLKNTHYVFVGYLTTEDGIEYKSAPQILTNLPNE